MITKVPYNASNLLNKILTYLNIKIHYCVYTHVCVPQHTWTEDSFVAIVLSLNIYEGFSNQI